MPHLSTRLFRTAVAVWLLLFTLALLFHVTVSMLVSQGRYSSFGTSLEDLRRFGSLDWRSPNVSATRVNSTRQWQHLPFWVALVPTFGGRLNISWSVRVLPNDPGYASLPDPKPHLVRDPSGWFNWSETWQDQLPSPITTRGYFFENWFSFFSGRVFELGPPQGIEVRLQQGREVIVDLGPSSGWRHATGLTIDSWIPLAITLIPGAILFSLRSTRQAFWWWLGLPLRAFRAATRRLLNPSPDSHGFPVAPPRLESTNTKTKFTTPTGTTVTLSYNVKESLQVGDVLVVLLDVPPNQSMTENVFALSHDGTVLWQIERTPETATDPVNIYVGATATSDNTVRLANWNGTVVDVNIQTGRIIQSRLMK